MKKKDKRIFLTADDMSKKKRHDIDEKIIKSVSTGEGLIQITSAEQLQALAEAAKKTYDHFGDVIKKIMTKERAEFVKNIRMKEGYTWRAVAAACHHAWQDADWSPPSNQLAGMKLCAIAGEILGETVD